MTLLGGHGHDLRAGRRRLRHHRRWKAISPRFGAVGHGDHQGIIFVVCVLAFRRGDRRRDRAHGGRSGAVEQAPVGMTGRRLARFAAPALPCPRAPPPCGCVCRGGARQTAVVRTVRAGVPSGEYRAAGISGGGCASRSAHSSQRRKTGTFIFWTAAGARIAVIPTLPMRGAEPWRYGMRLRTGRVEAGTKAGSAVRRLTCAGVVRSWHPNGAARASIGTNAAS